MEEVKLNIGGVVGRSYQLSVYKIKGVNWYVNVQTASPLLTYYQECKRSQLLEKYRLDVAKSFRRNLERLIQDDLRCKGLVEVIYYNGMYIKWDTFQLLKFVFNFTFYSVDLDEYGELIDVGVVLKKYIQKYLNKKALQANSKYIKDFLNMKADADDT